MLAVGACIFCCSWNLGFVCVVAVFLSICRFIIGYFCCCLILSLLVIISAAFFIGTVCISYFCLYPQWHFLPILSYCQQSWLWPAIISDSWSSGCDPDWVITGTHAVFIKPVAVFSSVVARAACNRLKMAVTVSRLHHLMKWWVIPFGGNHYHRR